MIPWLLDLADKPFTKLPFEQIWALRSGYALRLFELLLQYQNTKTHERTLSIEELRNYLGVADDKYRDSIENFRRRVVESSIRDINEKTAYKVECEKVKEGRRITGFKFKLHLPAEIKKEKRAKQIADIGNLVQGIADNKAMTPKEEKPTISEEQRAKNQKRLKELMGNIKSM
jgi:plasmid replication initiation protein